MMRVDENRIGSTGQTSVGGSQVTSIAKFEKNQKSVTVAGVCRSIHKRNSSQFCGCFFSFASILRLLPNSLTAFWIFVA